MKTLIISPTYNEAENIERLIYEINNLNLGLDILIIDDNSPDKTGKLVEDLQKKNSNLFLIKREKKLGLGTAYTTGIKFALEKKYEAVVEMDADLSHDPNRLPEILKQLENFDLVIGSRYVKGGGVRNWSLFRRLISRLGGIYARFILGIKINDFTAGFNGFKTDVFKKVGLEKIKSNGYSYNIELKYRICRAGFSFVEIPIIFIERRAGKSKISKKIIFEAFLRLIKWKIEELFAK